MGKHAGKSEAWIEARAAVKRGRGALPRHAKGGRHAAAPGGLKRRAMRVTTDHYGWTVASIAHAARIGAL